MRTKELIRSIARRTQLPIDEVQLVLNTLKDIALEQVGMLESLEISGFCKVAIRPKHGGGWKVVLVPKSNLAGAIGRDLPP